MSKVSLIIFDSSKSLLAQSVLAAGIASLHANPKGSNNSVVYKDIAALSSGDITTYLGTLVANTYDSIYICTEQAAAAVTAHQMFVGDISALNTNLKTANRGSVQNVVLAGTAGSNVGGATQVVITGGSAVDDTYNGMYLKTTISGVDRYFKIADYVGATTYAVIVNGSTAITDTSTFTIFTQPNIFTVGDTVSSLTPAYDAWSTLFPSVSPPPLVSLMSGTGTVNGAAIQPHLMVAQTADTFTISSVTKAGAFTNYLTQLNRGTCYLAAVSATTGAGQVVQILSATANVLTTVPFATIPTGTLVFQVCTGNQFCLYEIYMKYALETYLSNFALAATLTAYPQLLDMLNVIPKGSLTPAYNATMLDMYAKRGRAVFDAIQGGYVTA